MDEQRRGALFEGLAADAERLREEFLDVAGRQFRSFIDANRDRLRELGGLVLIDDGPEYLSVDAEGHFSSRSRFQDDDGAWVAETEEIEDAAELVEIFNPAELYAAFIDAVDAEGAEDAVPDDGEADDADVTEPDADDEPEGTLADEPDLADDWTEPVPAPATHDEAARLLYDLALTFQERSQWREAQLLDDFSVASGELAAMVGDAKIVEDEDERLWFRANGRFEGEVVPESNESGEPVWQTLTAPDDFVQFYDPTDLFGDLAEALAERYPHVAPEFAGDGPDVADEG